MSNRLTTIAKFIPPYQKIADIGCDHGYLIIEAFKQGITYAQAIDNKEGPLKQAINNLKTFQDKVEFILSDGISKINADTEVVIIAGMGGSLIVDILRANPEKLASVKRLILQPNRNIKEVRKFLNLIGFKIAYETIIEEEGIYYEIIVCDKGLDCYNETELEFGPYLLKEKSPVFLKKWTNVIKKYQEINTSETTEKAKEIMKILNIEV